MLGKIKKAFLEWWNYPRESLDEIYADFQKEVLKGDDKDFGREKELYLEMLHCVDNGGRFEHKIYF